MEAEGQWQISEREICWSVVFIATCSIIILLYVKLWYRPQRIRSVLQKQGINGPKPSFPFGNISEMQQLPNQLAPVSLEALDEWAYSLYPYFHTWKQRYGTCMNTFRSNNLCFGDYIYHYCTSKLILSILLICFFFITVSVV